MVDASNWGDAVTSADIAGGMRSEIHRHCAAKSAWARLLSPFKAMQRGKGCLGVEDELPQVNTCILNILCGRCVHEPLTINWCGSKRPLLVDT